MLTPAFELTQNDEFLFVSIQVPFAKASEVEVHFEDNDFMFYSKPYYLRLNLPGKVLFNDEPPVKYDFDKKTFTISAEKAKNGEVFEGLDLVTLLLAPKKNQKAATTPLIEVLEASSDVFEEDEELDWSIEQIPSEEKFGDLSLTGQQCGFANSYTFKVFDLKEETSEIFDIAAPQNKSPAIRSEERIEAESNKFSEDHYVADLYHDEEIQELLHFSPEWDAIYADIQEANPPIPPDDKVHFTSEEKERLRKLPSKEYLLDKEQMKSSFLSLIDILFAYAYDKRTTLGESTIESAWTVNKLSATLSWLELYSAIPQVSTACIRRSLIYPLYRHFELALTVLEDVRKIILCGRKYIIRCLLNIHEMFCQSEPRYILNDLFITDYIVWMQTKSCSNAKLAPLAKALEKVLLTKGDIGLKLVEVETFAKVAWMTQQPSPNNNTPTANKKNETSNLPKEFEKLSLANDSSSASHSESEPSSPLITLHRRMCDLQRLATLRCMDSSSSYSSSDSDDDEDDDDESSSDCDEESAICPL
ncbi:hypothetical protein JTE90_018344 [Oedothorax gibbosus]|uniref:Protein SHQ1 homolog n=1 Tax=Oedothorax gibbosus TaxID=931172 RepID=A0AAV6U0K3_9ARAC|nr:hypothetical protein JTE90_018344 [Oedothorax gibbosus]